MFQFNKSFWLANSGTFFVYFLFGPAIFLYHALDRFKLIYATPIIFLLMHLWYSRMRITLDSSVFLAWMGFLGLILLSTLNTLVSTGVISFSIWVRDIIVISSPLIIMSLSLRFKDNHAKVLFLIWFLSYFAWFGISGHFSLEFDVILGRKEGAEMDQASFLGFFFLYFLIKREYGWLAFAGFYILLAGKRAVFLGLLPSLAFYVLFFSKTFNYRSKFSQIVLAVYYFAFFGISLYLVEIAQFFLDMVGMGDYKLSGFLMGRNHVVEVLRPEIMQAGFLDFFIGHGPGQADIFLGHGRALMWSRDGLPANPHNDFLKIAYEYGMLGVIGFFFILRQLLVRNAIGFFLLMYAIPIFLVDNSLIFVWHFLTAGILIYQEQHSSQSLRIRSNIVE